MSDNIGYVAEKHIGNFLKSNGFKLLKYNYHTRFGEIDIIAKDKEYILFVEVKARELGAFVSGFEAVDRRKQNKIILSAKHYLLNNPSELQPRFDVACVHLKNSKIIDFDYLENAFGE